MKRSLQIALLLIVQLTFMCKAIEESGQNVDTILINASYLENTKKEIDNDDPKLKDAFDLLIKEAELALNEGPFSVTHKDKVPPSGDQHDYASYSRYWWPDPDKPDGLPYIRRDGETNPSSQSLTASDRQRIGALGKNVETLGLAYYFTKEEKYAIKVAELLRVWFLDEATRMNPNVNHAQCRLGHNQGSKTGVLDGRLMIGALEGSLLIAGSSALSGVERDKLKDWAGEYYKWLTTNNMALDEAAAKNNHGSFYDVQAMYYSLYSGNPDAATQIANRFVENRVKTQINSEGLMPEELARTRPLFYSIYNLHAMFLVAQLAEKVEVDIWQSGDEHSRLRMGLDYIIPYANPDKPWPNPTLGKANRMEMFALLKIADQAYPDQNYLNVAENLPLTKRKVHRSNLAFPLMR